MFTDELPDDECALFVFPRSADHTFWNKNVSYPLSLAFCDEGMKVIAIRNMEAMSETPCKSGNSDVKFVIEVSRGALEGVSEGDVLDIDPSTMTIGFR